MSNGAPYAHPYMTQRAGTDGPLLLQDFHLIDLLSHFDRERIPERVVHAKGSGAHGVFECTDGLEDLCVADMFKKGTKCPLTIRFSTVGRETGSSDLARDPRGFAVKFKTAEGNWDFVANNTPVFFRTSISLFLHTARKRSSDCSKRHSRAVVRRLGPGTRYGCDRPASGKSPLPSQRCITRADMYSP